MEEKLEVEHFLVKRMLSYTTELKIILLYVSTVCSSYWKEENTAEPSKSPSFLMGLFFVTKGLDVICKI